MRDLRVRSGTIELQVRAYELAGPPIIFLHFGGGNLMMWQRAIPYFQDHYHLILVDLRDHGKSDKPQADDHIDQMARDVVGVMDHLQLERAHIIGSSLGAEVGLSLAANYPGRVRSLVCDGALNSEFGPYGTWDGSEAEFKEYVTGYLEKLHNRPKKVFPSVAALVEDSKRSFEEDGCWNQFLEAFYTYNAYEREDGQFVHSWQRGAVEKYMASYFYYRFEDYYCRVQCPVLLAAGEEEFDEERVKMAAQAFARLAPEGELVVVPGWSHPFGWLIDPEQMCKVILAFLEKLPAG